MIDTCDDLMEVDIKDQFVADCERRQVDRDDYPREMMNQNKQTIQMGLEKSEQVIRSVEAKRASLFTMKGNQDLIMNWQSNELIRSAGIDENYLVIGSHVDQALQEKIVNNEFVDFAKLLPRNRFSSEDNRLELVSKGGATYFVPAADKDNTIISNFSRWKQAFRVFSNIFTRVHPQKVTQLIQYNHIIHLAANTYVWDNVYMYNKEFRMHISHFSQRNWSVILQQAWSMYLRDRLPARSETNHFSQGGKKEIWRRFNKGKCPNGASCKYNHHCEGCGKFGHGLHICRKRNNNGNLRSPSTGKTPMQESTK